MKKIDRGSEIITPHATQTSNDDVIKKNDGMGMTVSKYLFVVNGN